MQKLSISAGLMAAVIAAVAFGASGPLVKPLLDAGWSPSAAVTARALTGGIALLPVALFMLRGRWASLWRARWRILLMGVIGVAFTQLAFFAAIQTIPVSTANLIELLAPVLLVIVVALRTRRMPRPLVLLGSVLAVGGLILVIGPGALQAVDPVGLTFAFLSLVGCAIYFVVAALPSDGLPPVAFASFGLIVGGLTLALLSVTRILPFTATFDAVPMYGNSAPWWLPLVLVAIISTALAYAAGITAAGALGSRLASFVGLLEVVFSSLFAWLLLGQALTPLQLLGGLLILGGITAVRAERADPATAASEPLEPASVRAP